MEFLALTDGDVRSMVPPIGLANKILRMVPKQNVSLTRVQ